MYRVYVSCIPDYEASIYGGSADDAHVGEGGGQNSPRVSDLEKIQAADNTNTSRDGSEVCCLLSRH